MSLQNHELPENAQWLGVGLLRNSCIFLLKLGSKECLTWCDAGCVVDALCSVKTLGQERHAINAELLTTFGDADLRFGCSCPWWLGSQAADSNQLGLRPHSQKGHKQHLHRADGNE